MTKNLNDRRINIEHLKMIEGVIDRLARNSSNMKGWFLAIIVALFGFRLSRVNISPLWVIFLGVVFWALDSYYLRLERKYCRLFADIASGNKGILPFSMATTRYNSGKQRIISALFSFSTIGFYLPVMLGVVLITHLDFSVLSTQVLMDNAHCPFCNK